MRGKMTLQLVGSLLLLLAINRGAIAQDDSSRPNYALYCERATRELVIDRVAPKVPQEVLRDGAQGLIVVAVVFDEEGRLLKAAVLEAPHPLLKQAVIEALKEWRIAKRTTSLGPIKPAGWLTFDFRIIDGEGQFDYAAPDQLGDKEDRKYRHPFVKANREWFYRYD